MDAKETIERAKLLVMDMKKVIREARRLRRRTKTLIKKKISN